MKNLILDRVNNLLLKITSDVMGVKLRVHADYDKKAIQHLKLYDIEPRVYLQVVYKSPCSKTKKLETWKGRKHYLSDYMTDDEVVKTAYTAVKMAVEHEIMEGFKFDGKLIFNPHTPYTELMTISDKEVVREKLWTKKEFLIMPYSEVFATGTVINSPEGLYMTNSNIGKEMTWVAKKGGADDWAMYAGWTENGVEWITASGDKVPPLSAQKLLNCNSQMLKCYRR